jgi:hypothetical protein
MALLGALLFGFVVGTALRLRLERMDRPQRHLGRSEGAGSAGAAHPHCLAHAGAMILEPGQREEEIA